MESVSGIRSPPNVNQFFRQVGPVSGSYNTEFQWSRLITFAVFLLTARQNDRTNDSWQTNSPDATKQNKNLQCEAQQAYPPRNWNIVVFTWSKTGDFKGRADGPADPRVLNCAPKQYLLAGNRPHRWRVILGQSLATEDTRKKLVESKLLEINLYHNQRRWRKALLLLSISVCWNVPTSICTYYLPHPVT